MSEELKRLERVYANNLNKFGQDRVKVLADFVDQNWKAESADNPQLKDQKAWTATFQTTKKYKTEEARLEQRYQDLIRERDTTLYAQQLFDIKQNRIAENLQYSRDYLPLGGDWITFLIEPKDKVDVAWVQNGFMRSAKYYRTTCWFGKLILQQAQTSQAAVVDDKTPFYYQHELQLKNWQALALLDKGTAFFSSQGWCIV